MDNNDNMKRCSRGDNCIHPMGCWQPMNTDHFHVSRKEKSGFKNACKACRNNDYHKNAPDTPKRKKHRESRVLRQKGLKRCPKCDTVKPLDNDYFAVANNRSDGFQALCKQCESDYRMLPQVKSRIRKYNRLYSKTEKYKLYQRIYRNRPDRKRHRREYHCKRARNLHVKNVKRRALAKYRARKNNLPDTFTKEQEQDMFNYFGDTCPACGVKYDMFIVPELDHWIPLNNKRCPGTVVENMVPLCGNQHGLTGHLGCNQSKSDLDAYTWLVRRFGKDHANKVINRINDYFRWVSNQNH
jgi:hypothetical protein